MRGSVSRLASLTGLLLLGLVGACDRGPTAPSPRPTPTPPPANTAPVIGSMAAQGGRPNQPDGMADLGEAIAVSAVVTDAESAPSALTFQWTATIGAFEGPAGASVTWRAPATLPQTPVNGVLTLTVIEPYQALDAQGQIVTLEHRVVRTIDVRVHDSITEISAISRDFLIKFSQSNIAPDQVVTGFWDGCPGKAEELLDAQNIRCEVTHNTYTVGPATSVVIFGGQCPSPNAPFTEPGDGCSSAMVHWDTTANPGVLACPRQRGLVPGQKEVAEGLDVMSLVYRGGEWRLCTSNFLSTLLGGAVYKK